MSFAIDPELIELARKGAAFADDACAKAGTNSAAASILIATLIANLAQRIPATYRESLADAKRFFDVDPSGEGATTHPIVFDATGCGAACVAARVFAELVQAAQNRPGTVWVDEEARA